MLAAAVNEGVADGSDPAGHQGGGSELSHWLIRHVSPGRILNLGSPAWSLPLDPDEYSVVTVKHLVSALEYEAIFDHAWANNVLDEDGDPANLVRRVFNAIKPGGTLVLTVPFGVSRDTTSTRVFYFGSLRRLLEPLFEITELEMINGYIAATGTRRDQPAGAPAFLLDPDEMAFYGHDHRLKEQLEQFSAERVRSGELYRGAIARADRFQADLERTRQELTALRRKVARLRPWLAGPLAIVRGARRIQGGAARRSRMVATLLAGRRPSTAHQGQTVIEDSASIASTRLTIDLAGIADVGTKGSQESTAPAAWRDTLRAKFEAWLIFARAAEGNEVVVMFSGTTFVQEHRGNRPIRLTNVYIGRKCPVFFNYYRWSEREALPEHPDALLFQSPIDATPTFLDALLTADFGGKAKIFFVSFPHELMVRYLTAAAQHGWVTVYDARDDWEEFAKVGMAKWYLPGYEWYVATHADIATAVSRPLARKISALARDRLVHVVPNALDTRFPRPVGGRKTTVPPVIGYFGHLTDKWLDWPLVIAAAKRYPEYAFELAGHQQPKLELPFNVRLLGLLGHGELAERSRTWSVALIPFKNGPLADAVDPIKIYEYLHLGLPVLTTYFPQCRDYPGTTITEGREEFLERLAQVVGTEPPERETGEWLALNTWERRVDTYSELAAHVRQRGRHGVMALLGGGK
jgi:glycosyltransferase involved in cell wall biosynthesis/SAM-dependent methyltransferase